MNCSSRLRFFALAGVIASVMSSASVSAVERRSIDKGWAFSFGHTDPARDFDCGTEYFNYLTKANSVHNTGPYSRQFNDSAWVRVDLPFDFVVDLPFDSKASHSHGYKQVGYMYPSTSVGWYRRKFSIDRSDESERVYLVFDGIFRDSRVWVNGFYLGGEPSGYAEQRYDITPYLSDGDDNIITVRSDATLEEGWFYEGGGIYRHAWLETAPPIHVKPSTLKVSYGVTDTEWGGPLPTVNVSGTVVNASHRLRDQGVIVRVELIDTDGNPVGGNSSTAISIPSSIAPMGEAEWSVSLRPEALRLWSPSSPSLYDVRVTVDEPSGKDVTTVRTGFRTLSFDADKGLAINGEPVRLYGVNQHQDHAGVGAGIPDAVNVYRLKELKKYGVNTIRTSHNPATPEMLAACDSLGLLVVEENRLLGVNDYHVGQFKKMIDRDFNHPSVIMWSAGNEEWGVEWDKRGTEIVSQLRDVVNGLDPTRPMAAATSGGPTTVISPDVAGYNYIMQNPVEKYRTEYPERIAFGSEETTGCGTRGVYFDDRENGRMASMNRVPELERDSVYNRIARGWKFYRDRPWLLGLCYWTGFDYRGEPNPLKYPATGSQFGLLDYAGFPKDEAYYIKSQWVDEPMVHILPHWNLEGHEGETIPVWVYGNVDEVELVVNGKNLGRKKMTPGDYLEWDAVYRPGKVVANGYRDGRKVAVSKIETAGRAVDVKAEVAHEQDGVSIVNVSLVDKKGRFVPTACDSLTISLPEGVALLGAGNGDPAFRGVERPLPGTAPDSFTIPAFNGHAQFILSGATGIPEIRIQ